MATDTLQPVAPQFAANVYLGPSLIGWTLAFFLSGLSLCNFISYSLTSLYAQDRRRTRWCLWALTGLTIGSAGCNAGQLWYWALSQRRSVDALEGFEPLDCYPAILQGFAQAIAQTLLAERAMKLVTSKKARHGLWTLYVLIGTCLAFSGLDITACSLQRDNLGYLIWPLNYNLIDIVWYSLAALIDVLITVVLVIDFRLKMKQAAGAPAATRLLHNLIKLSLYTAAITTLAAIGAALSSLMAESGPPVRGLYFDLTVVFASILPSLYSLSLITTLRSRKRLRAHLYHPDLPQTGHWPADDLLPPSFSAPHKIASVVKARAGRKRQETDDDLKEGLGVVVEEPAEGLGLGRVHRLELTVKTGSVSSRTPQLETTWTELEKPQSPRIEEIV